MKLSDITLLNEGRGVELSEEHAVKWIEQKAHKRLGWGDLVQGVRMVSGRPDLYLVDPKQHTRVSANTTNEYTLLMDEYLKSWQRFPDRKHSVVFHSHDGEGLAPSNSRYIVIPEDGAKIGLAPTVDLWDSFYRTINDSMMIFNDSLRAIYLGIEEGDPISEQVIDALRRWPFYNWERVREKVSTRISGLNDLIFKIIDEVIKQGGFLEAMEVLLSPDRNNFILTNDVSDVRLEAWTDAECLLIKVSMWPQMKEILGIE